MKSLILIASTAVILSLSSVSIASSSHGGGSSDDAFVDISESSITQLQWGGDLDQKGVIGLVSSSFNGGDAAIIVSRSSVTQTQFGHHGKQEALMGVIGCDCGDSNHR